MRYVLQGAEGGGKQRKRCAKGYLYMVGKVVEIMRLCKQEVEQNSQTFVTGKRTEIANLIHVRKCV